MKIIDYIYDIENAQFVCETYKQLYNIRYEKIIYFDIETTGLSSGNSTLYLIGALSYEKDKLHLRQWFNEDGYSENELINSFNEYCMNFTHIIHFNGLTFDLPYIREKASKNDITISNIDNLIQIDIFKEIRSYKKVLGLDNMKQVTIEKYLGIDREDTYQGGELINVYQRYVARPDDEIEHKLLLHNHDDVMGLPMIFPILNYTLLFEKPDIQSHNIYYDSNKLTIELTINDHCIIQKRITMTNKHGIYINASGNTVIIILPVINENLKHFFKDYKNYYYLPKEDMAVHKSVASYVNPENRVRATKKNCYITKTDSYIMCQDNDFPEIFYKEFGDKISYQPINSLINDTIDNQRSYIRKTLINFLKK